MLNHHIKYLPFAFIFFTFCSRKHFEKNYVDFVITNNKIFALTATGHINLINANTGDIIDTNINSDTSIIAIALDKKGNVITANANKKLELLNQQSLKLIKIKQSKDQIYNMVFSKDNKIYLITSKGINNVSTGKIYPPDTTVKLNHQVRGWSNPSAIFMDKDDNIWLGYGFGEWGGELYIFSTKQSKFLKLAMNNCCLEPVQSIFADDNSIYISSGLDHMETSGCITKIDNFHCSQVFSSNTYWKGNSANKQPITGEYIGPALFNKKDNAIYFYSQNGIFKGNVDRDLSQINAWTKIATPKLHWTYGQAKAAGSPMNVIKMEYASNGKLFLLTVNDGIGVYDGKNFSLLN